MRLTLHQLRLLLAVTREGSVSRAAQRLHLTQPTLSTQLRQLAEAQPNIEMKGFRKGKVPMALLKKQFGQRILGAPGTGSRESGQDHQQF